MFKRNSLFFDFDHKIWMDIHDEFSYQFSGTINFIRLAHKNLIVLYFRQVLFDNHIHDNENRSGMLGFNFVF